MKNYFFCFILPAILLGGWFSCQNQPFTQGKKLYDNNCASCHQENGEGLGKLYPPIKSSDYWIANQEKLPCIIRYGLSDTIIVNGVYFQESMKGHLELSDAEISNIINFINQEWYKGIPILKAKELKRQINNCKE